MYKCNKERKIKSNKLEENCLLLSQFEQIYEDLDFEFISSESEVNWETEGSALFDSIDEGQESQPQAFSEEKKKQHHVKETN